MDEPQIERPLIAHKVQFEPIERPSILRSFTRNPITNIVTAISFWVVVVLLIQHFSLNTKSAKDYSGDTQYQYYSSFQKFEVRVFCRAARNIPFATPKECNYKNRPKNWVANSADWMLVIIGVLQAFIFIGQRRIMARQSDIAADTLEFIATQERPYLLITDLRQNFRRNVEKSGYDREYVAVFKNYGKTPAIVHAIEFEDPMNNRLDRAPDYNMVYDVNFIVAPDRESPTYGFSVYSTEQILYFYIRVRYSDVFGKFWVTSFAFRMEGSDSTRIGGVAFNNDRRDQEPRN